MAHYCVGKGMDGNEGGMQDFGVHEPRVLLVRLTRQISEERQEYRKSCWNNSYHMKI